MLLLLPFQYISCYSLSVKKFTIPSHICSFNTSHVTLYLFSSFFSFRTSCRFNTSHVTLYLNHREIWFNCNFRFNTSHVTLYLYASNFNMAAQTRFNTSHVTLYRNGPRGCFYQREMFQYISCYSLSCLTGMMDWISTVSIHLMLLFIQGSRINASRITLFQYISCYSLSNGKPARWMNYHCFNTSHVTLYLDDEKLLDWLGMFQYISCYSLSICRRTQKSWKQVSIHLMLLFISGDVYTIDRDCTFQYISCYSLSLVL